MEAHAGDRLPVGRETNEEERHVVAVFEILSMKGPFEAAASVLSFRLIEVERPQIGSLQRVMALEPDSRGLISETCAVPVMATNGVTHDDPFPSAISSRPLVRGPAKFSPNYSFLKCETGGAS